LAEIKSPASKVGQIIGEVFEQHVLELVNAYLSNRFPDYELLQPKTGKKTITLEMLGGLARQMDHIIIPKGSSDPVALLETKWLKDARHHNDKGAWILQLREVRKKHPTIRGAAAILLGFWTAGVGLMLMSEGGIRMVLVATDEQVYSTLQQPLDAFLGGNTFKLDALVMRGSYPRPHDLLALLNHLQEHDQLASIARSWFDFVRGTDPSGAVLTGKDLVHAAIDDLLAPLPPEPTIKKFEIALQLDTGNTIYEEFTDAEEALAFLQTHFQDPQQLLKRITPRQNTDTTP